MSSIGGKNLWPFFFFFSANRASVILQLTSYKQICLGSFLAS